jgi:hypothetical protein
MSDRRFRRGTRSVERSRLTEAQFTALRTVSGHDWAIAGPWTALDPEAIALHAVSLLDAVEDAEGLTRRWRRVLAALAD